MPGSPSSTRQVEQQVRLYIASTNLFKQDDWTVIVGHHQPLASALIEGDAERAAKEAWLHNETFGKRLVSLMQDEEKG